MFTLALLIPVQFIFTVNPTLLKKPIALIMSEYSYLDFVVITQTNSHCDPPDLSCISFLCDTTTMPRLQYNVPVCLAFLSEL